MSDVTHFSTSDAGTYDEWRVTGQPDGGYPAYSFVWSVLLNPHLGDPEGAARSFMASVTQGPVTSGGIRKPWIDGPHLSHRTVVISEWAPGDLEVSP